MDRRDDRGTVLLQALIMIFMVVALIGAMVTLATGERLEASVSTARVRAQAAADGACEVGVRALIAAATQATPLPVYAPPGPNQVVRGYVNIAGLRSPRIPQPGQVGAPTTLTMTAVGGTAASDETLLNPSDPRFLATVAYTIEQAPAVDDASGTTIANPRVATAPDGVQSLLTLYRVSSTVECDRIQVTVHRLVEIASTPVFQFAVFYGVDLEIDPGATMNINGRVQSNGDLYVSPSATLSFNTSFLHAAGQFFRVRGDGTAQGGTVNVQVAGSPPGTYQTWPSSEISSTAGFDSGYASGRWNGTVEDGAMGAPSLAVPNFQSTTPGGYYDTNASTGGLKIDSSFSPPHAVLNGTDVGTPGWLTTTSIWDERQGQQIALTDIDLGAMIAAGQAPTNGLLYAAPGAGTASPPKGVRLKNGANLSGHALTVVSPDPVYVMGDYNTATGANHAPSAVLGDALYLLSNSWNDAANANAGVRDNASAPAASGTTYNFAFVAGNSASTMSGPYGGGLENFPRFLENWGGQTCSYTGSMVCFQHSQEATAGWNARPGKSIYSPPSRNWAFDTSFLNPSSLPPFTPQAVSIAATAYWIER